MISLKKDKYLAKSNPFFLRHPKSHSQTQSKIVQTFLFYFPQCVYSYTLIPPRCWVLKWTQSTRCSSLITQVGRVPFRRRARTNRVISAQIKEQHCHFPLNKPSQPSLVQSVLNLWFLSCYHWFIYVQGVWSKIQVFVYNGAGDMQLINFLLIHIFSNRTDNKSLGDWGPLYFVLQWGSDELCDPCLPLQNTVCWSSARFMRDVGL